jgi:serine/threonine protein kinase
MSKKNKKHSFCKRHGGTLDRRIKLYDDIKISLQDIVKESCLTEVKNSTVFIKQYEIKDKIFLSDKLGRPCAYGIIYKTTVYGTLGNKYEVACKLIEVKDIEIHNVEVFLNTTISEKILKQKISRHFLFCYKVFECRITSSDIPKISQHGRNYYIILNELANGDLGQLYEMDDMKTPDQILNIICQYLLSIATFHKLGYIHQDCHPGNFLFLKNEHNDNEYFHYRINEEDYYLKNTGITMMIYDFGQSILFNGNIPPKYAYSYKDIKQVESINYDCYDYFFILKTLKNIVSDPKVNELVSEINKLLEPNKFDNEDLLITNMCKVFTEHKIMIKDLSEGAKILNDNPYIINDSLKEMCIPPDGSNFEDNTEMYSSKTCSSDSSKKQSYAIFYS